MIEEHVGQNGAHDRRRRLVGRRILLALIVERVIGAAGPAAVAKSEIDWIGRDRAR